MASQPSPADSLLVEIADEKYDQQQDSPAAVAVKPSSKVSASTRSADPLPAPGGDKAVQSPVPDGAEAESDGDDEPPERSYALPPGSAVWEEGLVTLELLGLARLEGLDARREELAKDYHYEDQVPRRSWAVLAGDQSKGITAVYVPPRTLSGRKYFN
eukprot:gb/GFBE01042803.1/.p1 GENE.gb/GFBE01042803.1/~~gb/GFBE01042803.1/.p1  ORF type:complete len:158 (+),score=36.98 gb/GFBE01042803.1/:1-474(+)